MTSVISIVLLMGAPFAFAQSGGLLSKHPQDKGFAFVQRNSLGDISLDGRLTSPPGGGSNADQARFECGKPGFFPEGK